MDKLYNISKTAEILDVKSSQNKIISKQNTN